MADDYSIIKQLLKQEIVGSLKGNVVWQAMEKEGVSIANNRNLILYAFARNV